MLCIVQLSCLCVCMTHMLSFIRSASYLCCLLFSALSIGHGCWVRWPHGGVQHMQSNWAPFNTILACCWVDNKSARNRHQLMPRGLWTRWGEHLNSEFQSVVCRSVAQCLFFVVPLFVEIFHGCWESAEQAAMALKASGWSWKLNLIQTLRQVEELWSWDLYGDLQKLQWWIETPSFWPLWAVRTRANFLPLVREQ